MNIFAPVKKLLSIVVKANDYALSVPPNPSMGDVSSAIAFALAKKKGKSPVEVAESIAKKIKPSGMIDEIKVVGPYINFFLNKDKFANKVIKEVFEKKTKPKNKGTISLDIFGPNAMKGIHIGHVRNTTLGGCLDRLLNMAGYKVKTNSFGCNIGLPVAKVIWGYMNLGLKPEGNKGEWLGKVYTIASESFKKDNKAKEQIYDINKRLYSGDETLIKVYNQLSSWSFDYVKQVEKKLRINIDKYFWERECINDASIMIESLKKKGLAKESEGALIVDLKKYGLGVYVLLTSQGVPTYEAKDLGLQSMKKKLFKADKYILFTGAEQVMHFQQIIKTLELLGFKKNSIIHIPYEEIIIDGKKISSREGNVILFNALIEELTSKALNEVMKKNQSLDVDQKRIIAYEIAISSLFYGMLKQDSNKKINFVMDEWVRFDGDTGAYIQYNYVRANKILSSQKVTATKIKITRPTEFELIKKINEFDDVFNDSVKRLNPAIIARYAYSLADSFSKFYEQCPIIKDGVNQERLLLAKAYCSRLGLVMKLMGFNPLKEM
ncbi:MAG: arginine--tRNA ligase [Candidatus Nanoarchaeia archaeon]|jgi:arginyl-tRNA synthetase